MHPLLEHYRVLVEFLGKALGTNCEVVLHDTGNHAESIVAIANGHVTGRSVGAPITALSLQWIQDRLYEKVGSIGPYAARAENGNQLSSSGFFIKDENGKLIGMVCVNRNLTHTMVAARAINAMLTDVDLSAHALDGLNDGASPEVFSATVQEFTDELIQRAIADSIVPPERMTPEEKIEILRALDKEGVFLLKGAVSIVAGRLATSEPTIYRYLQKVASTKE